jgi:hypothetical protein
VKQFGLLIALGLVVGSARPVVACPFCESSTAEQVRDGIFNQDFLRNAALALAPFPFLLSVVALLYFGPPPWYVRVRARPHENPDPNLQSAKELDDA